MDIGLPDILGYEVAKELRRKADPDARIVLRAERNARIDRTSRRLNK